MRRRTDRLGVCLVGLRCGGRGQYSYDGFGKSFWFSNLSGSLYHFYHLLGRFALYRNPHAAMVAARWCCLGLIATL